MQFNRSSKLAVITLTLATVSLGAGAQAIAPFPGFATAMPSGPVAGTRITPAYAQLVARDAYFWAWPLVNMAARRVSYAKVPERLYLGAAPTAAQ